MARGKRKHRSYRKHLKDIHSKKVYGVGAGEVFCKDCTHFHFGYYCNEYKRTVPWSREKRNCNKFQKREL